MPQIVVHFDGTDRLYDPEYSQNDKENDKLCLSVDSRVSYSDNGDLIRCCNDEISVRVSAVKCWLSAQYSVPIHMLTLWRDGRIFASDDEDVARSGVVTSISSDDDSIDATATACDDVVLLRAEIAAAVCGGKGGFGAMLRAKAREKPLHKTTDYGACRDLNGRRLRHVNDEIILQKWKAAKESGKEFDPSEDTGTGVEMWHLSLPKWAEGIKVDYRKRFMKTRVKTALCKDWLRAREGRKKAPDGAPPNWGCPRGRRCEFAHGTEELRGEAGEKMVKKKEEEQRDEKRQQKEDYLSVLYRSSKAEEEVQDLVMAGLRAAKRAKTSVPSQQAGEQELIVNATSTVPSTTHGSDSSDRIAVIVGEEVSSFVDNQEDASYLRVLVGDALVSLDDEHNNSNSSSSSNNVADTVDSVNRPLSLEDCPVLVGNSNFSTVIADAFRIRSGHWYYEAEIKSDGLMQIGWATTEFIRTRLEAYVAIDSPSSTAGTGSAAGKATAATKTASATVNTQQQQTQQQQLEEKEVEADGAGDDEFSWSFDGYRQQKWHSGVSSKYGPAKGSAWKTGDVVGCYLSLPSLSNNRTTAIAATASAEVTPVRGSIAFSINGQHCGEAFELSEEQLTHALTATTSTTSAAVAADASVFGFFPAVSLESDESVQLNFGTKPFRYQPSLPQLPQQQATAASGNSSKKRSSGKRTAKRPREEESIATAAAIIDSVVFKPVLQALLCDEETASTAAAAGVAADASVVQDVIATSTSVAATAVPSPSSYQPLDLEAIEYSSAAALEDLGLAYLKWELNRRGMKSGGTLQERCSRLFAARGQQIDEIDKRLMKKK